MPRRGRTIRETPRSRRRGGIADSVRSSPRRDQGSCSAEDSTTIVGRLDEQECQIVLDTGSRLNLLNANKFAYKTESGTAGEEMKLFTISREELPVLGKKNVLVNIGNFHSREEFILLRMVEDYILGSNFLRKHAAQLDFLTSELRIPGQDAITIEKGSIVKEVTALAIKSHEQVPPYLQELFSRCSEALDEEQHLKFLKAPIDVETFCDTCIKIHVLRYLTRLMKPA